MKKMMFLIVTVLFAVSFALPAAAEAFWPKETYDFTDPLRKEEYGTHAVDENYNLTEEPSFGEDKMWLYEWYNVKTGEFKPMGAYFNCALSSLGAVSKWSNCYTPSSEYPFTVAEGEATCHICSNGAQLLPAEWEAPVITYRVPVDGELSLQAALYPYGSANTSDNPDGGTSVYVYRNDTRIWPETEEQAKMTSDRYDREDPMQVSVEAFDVQEGDSIRLVVANTPGTACQSKGTTFVSLPVVTWHSVKYTPPENTCKHGVFNPPLIRTDHATEEGFTVFWSAVKNVDGYNVYVNGKKVNKKLIEGTEYTITCLEPDTIYEVTATSCYRECGHESAKSSAILARTRNKYDPVTDSSQNATATEVTDLPVTDTPSDLSTDTALPTDILSDTEQTERGVSVVAPSDVFITTEGTSSSGGGVLAYVCLALGAVLLIGAASFLILKKKRDPRE